MTAVNAIVFGGAAWLLTDGARYDNETGLTVGFSSKATTMPHLRLALSVTGLVDAVEIINRALTRFASFEEVVEGISECLRDLFERGSFDIYDEERKNHFRILMAGWSEQRKRGEIYALSTLDEPGGEAFTLFSRPAAMSPGIAEEDLRRAGLFGSGGLIVSDPAQFLGAVVDIQRRMPWPLRSVAGKRYVVGGHALLTKIDASGISQTVIRKWPDRVNEMIDPMTGAAASVVAITPPALSRLQRERMEKKARKGTLRA